eukprot:8167295-Pyramimonas_sp.AAC.1
MSRRGPQQMWDCPCCRKENSGVPRPQERRRDHSRTRRAAQQDNQHNEIKKGEQATKQKRYRTKTKQRMFTTGRLITTARNAGKDDTAAL